MSFYGPRSVWLHVGGLDLTGETMTMEESAESAFEEVHSFGSTWEEFLPVGIGKVTLAAGGGIYDSTGTMLEVYQDAPGFAARTTKQLVAWGMSDQTIGREAVLMDGTYAGAWKRIAERNALTKAEATHTVSGVYRRGAILHTMAAAETADGDTLGGAAPKGGVDFYDIVLNRAIPVGHIDTTTDYLYGQRTSFRAITSSNATSNAVICSELWGLKTGDRVWIAGHTGSTPDINGFHQVTVLDAFKFTLDDIADITVGGTGGTFQRINEHGLLTGDKIVISGQTGGTPSLNGPWTVTKVNNFAFTLDTVGDITVAGSGAVWKRVTSRGYNAHLHVSALTGCTDFTVTLLNSVDDDTYTSISGGTLGPLTPTNITDGTRTDKVDDTSTLIQRYVAIEWAFTGPSSPSCTFFVGLYRS